MRNTTKVKQCGYVGVTVTGGYFHIFSLHGLREVPGWSHDIPVIVGDCIDAQELDSMVNVLIRELEHLRKWSIRYSKTEKYDRDRLAAWTAEVADV
jgi:hypothetical protein